MQLLLDEITQITIYLQSGDKTSEKINEVTLYEPLAKKVVLDDESQVLSGRKWSFAESLPLPKRALLKIQTFFLQKMPILINNERKSLDAKFKTTLAILLSQKALAEYFLNEKEERASFFEAISKAAQEIGFSKFSLPPPEYSPSQIAAFLTTLSFNKVCLLEDIEELNLQIASMTHEDRDKILYKILNNIKRAPLISNLEINGHEKAEKISITTEYGKYKIVSQDKESGSLLFTAEENKITASIPQAQEKALMNQHRFLDTTDEKPFLLGTVSGELLNTRHVLEQILFLLKIKDDCFLLDESSSFEEKYILFTSLFSWNEYNKITDEHYAIDGLDGKFLKVVKSDGTTTIFRLNLMHINIPFNAFNKFPAPSEIQACINNFNDKALLKLTHLVVKSPQLDQMILEFNERRNEHDFLLREQKTNHVVEEFQRIKNDILENLQNNDPLSIALASLLSQKTTHHAIDTMIFLSLIARLLNITHNKNCVDATDRVAGAISVDKAQNAFMRLLHKPFLPGISEGHEIDIFRVLYSLYLVFEEPELNAGLSTGFVGEKFYHNFLQKNPETTYYLIPWLKKHPEMYLGLSKYRN